LACTSSSRIRASCSRAWPVRSASCSSR
jgi:hypothetical protein